MSDQTSPVSPEVEEARQYIADAMPALGYMRIGNRTIMLDQLTDQDAVIVAVELKRLQAVAATRGFRYRRR